MSYQITKCLFPVMVCWFAVFISLDLFAAICQIDIFHGMKSTLLVVFLLIIIVAAGVCQANLFFFVSSILLWNPTHASSDGRSESTASKCGASSYRSR
ncbi:hypothetical protein G6F42_023348 [Rhizopus arrhizus]|nr:hypothetical protein G6F42_023348 [Rhizopus arrhizus]